MPPVDPPLHHDQHGGHGSDCASGSGKDSLPASSLCSRIIVHTCNFGCAPQAGAWKAMHSTGLAYVSLIVVVKWLQKCSATAVNHHAAMILPVFTFIVQFFALHPKLGGRCCRTTSASTTTIVVLRGFGQMREPLHERGVGQVESV